MKLFCLTIIVLLSVMVCNAQNSQSEIFTNEKVMELVKAQFTADTIIIKIQTADSVNFDTRTETLTKLKNSGVDEKIIQAMLIRSASGQRTSSNTGGMVNGTTQTVKAANSQEKEKPNKFSLTLRSLTFDLDWCKASGDTIICEYTVTNNTDLRKSIIVRRSSPSVISDEKWNKRSSSSSEIGGGQDVMQPLAPNTGIRGRVIFEGLEKPLKVIKVLTLMVATPERSTGGPVIRLGTNWSDLEVSFRDVPVKQ